MKYILISILLVSGCATQSESWDRGFDGMGTIEGHRTPTRARNQQLPICSYEYLIDGNGKEYSVCIGNAKCSC